MTKPEIRMKPEARMTKWSRTPTFGFRHSSFIRISGFVIRVWQVGFRHSGLRARRDRPEHHRPLCPRHARHVRWFAVERGGGEEGEGEGFLGVGGDAQGVG